MKRVQNLRRMRLLRYKGKLVSRVVGWESGRGWGFIVPKYSITEIRQIPKSARIVDVALFTETGKSLASLGKKYRSGYSRKQIEKWFELAP